MTDQVTTSNVAQQELKPFIRWAGSKRLLIPSLLPHVPGSYGTYFEPFLGGGSLYLKLKPRRAQINDMLEPLANTWNQVRQDPDAIISRLSSWDTDKQTYLDVRAMSFEEDSARASQFLYLNRGAFGGLWRVNNNGKFNVPWSAPKTRSPLDASNLRHISIFLRKSKHRVRSQDFAAITQNALRDDFVFLDPPYSKSALKRPFIHYNDTLFDFDHQKRLAEEAERLRKLGAYVIVTNTNHVEIAALYPNFKAYDLVRHSSLGSHPSRSTQISERIFVSRR